MSDIKITRRHTKGFLLVELMLSFIIFVSVISAVCALYWSAQSALLTEPYRLQAFAIAKNILSSLQTQAQSDFDSVQSSLSATSSQGVTYTVNVVSTLNTNNLKYVTVTVSWQASAFVRAGSIFLQETVVDFINSIQNPTCHLGSGWFAQSLHLVGHGSIDIGTSSTSTGIAVQHDLLYLSADSPNKTEKDFYIVNTKNKDAPVVLSSLDTGPGIEAITTSGHYVYAANASINAQLQIIDVSSSTHPVIVTNFKLPGTYSDNGTVGASIFYRNKLIYLGTKKSDIAELHVINVSNISSPKEVGTFEVNTTIHRIIVHDHLIYIASPDDSEIRIIDSSDTSHLKEVGSFNASGGSGNGQALYQDGSTLYLGRTIGNNELYILDASTTAPAVIGSKTLNSSITDILVSNGLAFLLDAEPSKEFQMWNVGDKTKPSLMSTLPLGGRGSALACDGNMLYATVSRSSGFISISAN